MCYSDRVSYFHLRYSFVSEASATYKSFLQTLLLKIKEKQTYIDNAKALITKRNAEISDREKQVAAEVKDMAIKVINEINQRGKKLLTDLSAVCTAKKSQLSQKTKRNTSIIGQAGSCYQIRWIHPGQRELDGHDALQETACWSIETCTADKMWSSKPVPCGGYTS